MSSIFNFMKKSRKIIQLHLSPFQIILVGAALYYCLKRSAGGQATSSKESYPVPTHTSPIPVTTLRALEEASLVQTPAPSVEPTPSPVRVSARPAALELPAEAPSPLPCSTVGPSGKNSPCSASSPPSHFSPTSPTSPCVLDPETVREALAQAMEAKA